MGPNDSRSEPYWNIARIIDALTRCVYVHYAAFFIAHLTVYMDPSFTGAPPHLQSAWNTVYPSRWLGTSRSVLVQCN